MTTDERKAGRVFVSSTCYDLIDLRAVLGNALRDAGLEPVMSDQPDSGFVNSGDANSIETCLVNLRGCEKCIVILSQRYGRSLQNAGFEDLSATHLEYRTAIREKIPVLFYVRDRLEAECGLARKADAQLEPQWAQHDSFEQLRAFVEEHRALTNSDRSNWFWTFANAVDLAERVLADLSATASEARLRQLSREGALPLLGFTLLTSPAGQSKACACTLTVGGTASIGNVNILDPYGTPLFRESMLSPSSAREQHFTVRAYPLLCGGPSASVLRADYDIADGTRIVEHHAVVPDTANPLLLRVVPIGRRVEGKSARNAQAEIVIEGTFERAPWAYVNRVLGLPTC